MNAKESGFSRRVWRAKHRRDVLVHVAPDAFHRFGHSMDRQLAQFVSQWLHLAAPNAKPPRAFFRDSIEPKKPKPK